MTRKNRRKNRRGKKEVEPLDGGLSPEAQEELMALQAIYVDDLVMDEEGKGFDLKVLPHPGEAEANFVSVTLKVRYTEDYPQTAPEFKMLEKEGISDKQASEVLDLIVESAEDFIAMHEVYMFSLVILCQESLREWNEEAKKKSTEGPSLWDAMQRRRSEEKRMSLGGVTDASWHFKGSLFEDEAAEEIPVQKVKPPLEVKGLNESVSIKPRSIKKNPVKDLGSPVRRSHLARSNSVPSSSDRHRFSAADETMPGTVSSFSQSLMTLVQTMVERVVPMPSALLKFLGLNAPRPEPDFEEESDDQDLDETDKVRREMLMGYLLKLAASGGPSAMPANSLPVLLTHLHSKRVMPRWLQWIMTQRPTFFNRAFSQLFREEISEAKDGSPGADQASKGILKQFWIRGLSQVQGSEDRNLNSRYFSDFEEVRRLGRGGFGVVVSAKNRLDGRLYAIKKIKVLPSAADSYARIMREVSTLSRLQHPNVVRYFQAWFEAYHDDECLTTDLEDTLEGWQTTTKQVSIARARSLEPVDENDETQPTTASNSTSEYSSISQGRQFDAFGSLQMPPGNEDSVFDFASRSQATLELPSQDSSRASRSMNSKAGYQTLYIQMELCSRTLQQALEQQETLEADQKWEVLRQVLLGLAYIHSQRIIHRDLKPANIFYSPSGEIKLGDFGLAKFTAPTGEVQLEEGQGSSHQPPPQPPLSVPIDSTGVCGTSFYIAPEIANSWASYDSKVDMYSLGVIVFELWHSFSTGMERALMLRNLREKGVMPAEWQQENPKVAEVIRWLMSANPEDRPTAREVLQSPYLPPRVGDEQIRDLMRSLDSDAETYDRVVEGVFRSAASQRSGIDVSATDLSGGPIPRTYFNMCAQESVIKTVKEVFSCHGAIQMASSEVGLCHSQLPQDAVRVLSSSGVSYALKHDLRCPFAEWLVQEATTGEPGRYATSRTESIDGLRRFDVSMVYRQGRGVALTRAFLQADLDFVTTPAPQPNKKMLEDKVMLGKVLSEQLLAEAEVIKAFTEVVGAFKSGEADHMVEVKLSHTTLLLACLSEIGLPRDKQSQVMDLLSVAARASPGHASRGEKKWRPIQNALEGLGLSSSVVRHCRRYITKLAGDPDTVLPQLRSALLSEGQSVVRPGVALCLEELETLISLLSVWNLQPDQVVVEPLMKPEAEYYSGVFFQIHMSQPSSGTNILVGIGGRYDKLLNRLWASRGQASGVGCGVGAVGATLNMEPFMRAASVALADATTERSSADVLVCSRGGGTSSLEVRMDLVSRLWANGMKAEMLHKVAPSMTEQYEHAAWRGIRWLVTIDEQKLSASQTVRVKSLDRKTEEDVPFDEVASYIQRKRDALSSLKNR
ncbi:hypothetical protein BSKO_01627 [Bryopsis sp. KO-2023]|nr:hypothetical protein BSKO_01627 [Bryopsis sp. KO-2023]